MNNSRNYGIDLLRIVLTFMICILHTQGRNSLLPATVPGLGSPYAITWLMEILCYCAVDGYALISGYTAKLRGINGKPYSYAKLFEMWFQVFFYSFVMSIILFVCGFSGDMSLKMIVKSALPISCNIYWYFSAYAVLCVFRPYIDTVLEKLDDTEAKRLLVIILLFFCGSGILTDAYATALGYSGLWISVMYVVGYLIKRVNLFEKVKNGCLIVCWLAINVLSWLLFVETGSQKLITYISPVTVFSAVLLVLLFSRVNANVKFVRAIAPFTFGIYLFQSNRLIYENTCNRLGFIKGSSSFVAVFHVIGFAGTLFVVGLIVDHIRLSLFKVLKIKIMLHGLIPWHKR